MWRFLLGGLATVAGVVALFVASFGDVPAIWHSLERPVPVVLKTPAPETQPPASPDETRAAENHSATPTPNTVTSPQREAAESQLASLQQQLQEANQQLTALHDQASAEQRQLAQLQQQRNDAQAEVAKLHDAQQQLDDLEQQRKQAEAKLADLRKQQQQLASVQEQSKAEEAKLADLRAQQQQLASLKDQSKAEEAKLAQLRTEQQAAEKARAAAVKVAAEQAAKQQAQRADAAARAARLAQAEPAKPEQMPAKTTEPRPSVEADAASVGSVLQRLRHGPTARQAPPDAAPAPAPAPRVTMNAPPAPARPAWHQRLVQARSAVAEGRMGEAQRLLEEVQLQLVFRRPVSPDDPSASSGNPAAGDVAQALSLIGAGQQSAALRSIDRALGSSASQHAALPPLQPGDASWRYARSQPPQQYHW